MPDLRWDDLQVFLAVADHGTLAAAAAALGVAPSTLHRRVAALEDGLGQRLFLKDPRGYTLTPVGEDLRVHAAAVAEAVHGFTRAATGHDRRAHGVVRVAVADDLVPLLAPHLALLRTECPGVVPVLHTSARLVDLGREADVALRAAPRAPDDAIAHRVRTLSWAPYARSGDGHVPWVVYEGMDSVAAVRWRRRHRADVPVAARVSAPSAMAALLGALPAQGLLPCHLGERTLALRPTGPEIEEAATPLWLLVHVDLRTSARVRAFLDVVLPALRAEGLTGSG